MAVMRVQVIENPPVVGMDKEAEFQNLDTSLS